VVQPIPHPLPRRRNAQLQPWIVVAAERAVHRHQPIALHPPALVRWRMRLLRGRHRMAAHAVRQRHRRGIGQHAAMAQVLDAGAAQLAQAAEGRRVRAHVEQLVDPAACALQRRALVRRAKENHLLQQRRPAEPACGRLLAGTARHQPAHAVAHDRQRLQRLRPGVDQGLQQQREFGAIAGHRAAGVVVQVDGRVAEVARQRGAMVVAAAPPLQVVHAQAVGQHQQLRPRVGQRVRERLWFQRQRLAVAAQAHRDGQRVAAGLEVIAEHAVQRSQHRLALRQAGHAVEPGRQRRQHGCHRPGR